MKSTDRNDFSGHDPRKVDAPPEIFQRRLQLHGAVVALLAILTSVLLTVSFVGWRIQLPYLAYFALVPWGLALGGAVSRRWAILWAWMGGFIFWAINLYWLWLVDLSAYASGVLYLSVYWLVAAIVLRATSRRCWPMWICLPVVWVALEFIRGQFPVLGFQWLFMAHSQYCRPWLIQIADSTGQYGVSFLVVLANGVVIDLLALPLFGQHGERKAKILRRGPCGVGAFAVILAAMLTYGWYRTEKQSGHLSEGPSIAVVQQAFPISLSPDLPQASQEKVFEEHMRYSWKFVDTGCDMLTWAESMAPGGLNPECMQNMRGDIEEYEKLRQFQARITELLGKLKCPLLTGSQAVHYDALENQGKGAVVQRNSALWFNQSGKVVGQYAKRKLVPFSEYVPFKDSWPWLHRILRGSVPGTMPQLQPGKSWTRFRLSRGPKEWIIASPICFEGTFPDVCRQMVIEKGKKVTHVLINLSNDGWFVWKYGDRPYRDSSEHAQHLVQYYFRAVENRVPVVRCVNTGISASIDSNGREVARISRHGATMVPGAMLLGAKEPDENPAGGEIAYQIGPGVLVDSRVSLYSIVGDAFAWMLVAAAGALTGACLWRRRVEKKG